MVTTPPLPINRSVNEHSFYWYVQKTNIDIFFSFIKAFSDRIRVYADLLDQHASLSRSHSPRFPMQIVVRSNSRNKQFVRGINLCIVCKRNRAKMSTEFNFEDGVFTGHNVLILGTAVNGKSSLVNKRFQK